MVISISLLVAGCWCAVVWWLGGCGFWCSGGFWLSWVGWLVGGAVGNGMGEDGPYCCVLTWRFVCACMCVLRGSVR